MAENLNYKTEKSYCSEGDERNCDKYGRLYTWEDAQKICPDGYRLPSKEDYEKLFVNTGGASVAGEALKSSGGWYKKGGGKDTFGFSGLPAGYMNGSNNAPKYDGIGGYAYFWSSSENEDGLAYHMYLDFSSKSAAINAFIKSDAKSVRCIK